MKCWSCRLLATLLLFFWFGGGAHADLITPWTYTWSRAPVSVAADNNGTGGVSLTLSPLASGTNMVGDNSSITAVSLSTFSSAPTGIVDKFTNSSYSLTVQLTDLNSGDTGSLTFNGVFNGTLTATTAAITTTFLNPSLETQLGLHDYTVTLNSYLPPNGPDSTSFGYIKASVAITDAPNTNSGDGNPVIPGGGVQTVPEPSTLLLAGLALPAGLAWRRGRGGRGRDTAND